MTEHSLKTVLGTHQKKLQLVAPEPEEEEFQAVTFGRIGAKAQLMVMFQTADGFCEGFEYASLDGFTTADPNTSLQIRFGRKMIFIEGINLRKLLRMLMQHRLSEVADTGRSAALEADDQTPVITKLLIRNATADKSAGRA
jgi:hypothetical protein